MINDLIRGESIEEILKHALYEIHTNGPISALTFEKLAYIKKFHSEQFKKYENKLISATGLFYKTEEPKVFLRSFTQFIQNQSMMKLAILLQLLKLAPLER
ncbi:hypothetical protein [Vibrio lentus]|uniref:hypothetical protein n=1 Tax=Vibrio lentus TaxID=136468 RepID=UPI001F10DC26|nr:hypothetical protein [Vibrio lentus]